MTTISDIDIFARTLWGEARGEGLNGMTAVANVIMNRVNRKQWPNKAIEVCQQAFQFSCWNENDPNLTKLLSVDNRDPTFQLAQTIADDALRDELIDITNGADHYHERSISPSWAKGKTPVAKIGRHHFYKLT